MQKLITIAIAAAMLMVLTPAVNAENKQGFYDVPSGPSGNLGSAISTRPCATEWREWEGGLIGGDDDPTDPAAGEALTLATETGCGAVDPEGDGAVRMGVFSATVQADCGDCYTNFVVSVEDDNFDSTFFNFCVITDYSDGTDENTCGDDLNDDTPDFPASGCGSATVNTGGVLSGSDNRLATFVYATFVDEDTLELCFGSSGFMSIVMS